MEKIFFTVILSLFFLSSAIYSVQAAGLVPCGGYGESACTLCHVFELFDNLMKFFLVPCSFNNGFPLIPALAVLMIAIGGFMYIFAYSGMGGGPDLINRANTLFKSVIIGLLIAYGAWIILQTFFVVIGVRNPGLWSTFNCTPR